MRRPRQVLWRWIGRAVAGTALVLQGATALAAIDINQASEADLDGLRGLGPATTRLILTERAKAPFKNWQDLLARVKGIGTSNAAKLSSEGLTVNGQSFEPRPGARP